MRCLETGLFRDGLQLCSGLVDLVACIRGDGRRRHRRTLAGDGFVGVVTEDVAQVGDHVDDFRKRRRGERTRCETGDGGSRFITSEPVEQGGEDG